MSDYVAEGGHWYDKDGKPAYTQVTASGKNKGQERPTTIRDARKQNLVPSVTTITSILDKPALTHWKISRAIHVLTWDIYNWMRDKGVPASISAAFKLAFKAHQPDMEDKAGRGSEIHAALEQWIQGKKYKAEFQPYIDILIGVLDDLELHKKYAVAERSFTATEGYGGAVDLSFTVGGGVIIDFKTKDMYEHEGKLYTNKGKEIKQIAYDEHVMQLAAYRRGLGLPAAKVYNLFLSRDNPSVYKLVEWAEHEVEWGDAAFMSVFEAWKLLKRYYPNG